MRDNRNFWRRNLTGRALAVLASTALLTNSVAPAVAATLVNRRQHAIKPGPKIPVMKGVPKMDLSKQVAPSHPVPQSLSKLDDQAKLRRPATPAELADWRVAAAKPGKSLAKARAIIWLGEYALGEEEPAQAGGYFERALSVAPTKSREHDLAAVDHGLSSFFQGAYADAKGEFDHILRAHLPGVDRKYVAILLGHARACAGEHEERRLLGITEPQKIDPLCAVASLAVCLRELGLPHDKALVSRAVWHNGEGSNLQDVVDAAPRLGVSAFVVGTADWKKLLELPTPLVVHVEHEHFISVLKADAEGVTYNCSDCGSWPGGRKHVTRRQWQAMAADAYAVITPRGSALDLAMHSQNTLASASPLLSVLLGSEIDDSSQVAVAQRAANLIASLAIGQGNVITPTYECGFKTLEQRCPMDPSCGHDDEPIYSCPMFHCGSGKVAGPSSGEPVDLATGEEEYRPGADLDVYNPLGPSIHWARIYDSLRTDGTYSATGVGNPLQFTGFNQGWSDPYNVEVGYTPNVSGGGEMAPGQNDCAGAQRGYSSTTPYQGYVLLDNGAFIHFAWPSGASPFSSTHTTQVQNVDAGYPVAVTEYYDSSTGNTWVKVVFPDRTTWATNPGIPGSTGTGLSPSAVTSMTDRNGNAIYLGYSYHVIGGYAQWILTSLSNSSGALLTLQVNSTTGRYTEADDCYGRSVYYNYDGTYGLLYQVSQVVATGTSSPPIRYQFGYEWDGNGPDYETFQFLDSITVPSPTGSGTSTEAIHYSSYNGLITGITDANGNTVTFSGGGTSNSTKVTYANSSSTNEYQYTVTFDSHMDETAVKNAAGTTMWSAVYSDAYDPYRPSSISDDLSHTWNLTWSVFGQMLSLETPKGTFTSHSYSYSSFPLGELTSEYTGSQLSTTFTYYEPSGHIETVNTPIPGNVGGSSRQSTTYSWSSLGNLTEVQSPGNNATTYHTTSYGYTTDGMYSQGEALGQPITVTDSLSKVTHLRYDSQNNLLNETNAIGNEWQATYNLANQVTEIEAPATGNTGSGNAETVPTYLYVGGPTTTVTAYDESGSAVRSVSYSYGLDGETLGVTGDAETTSVTYGSPYWIKALTDGNSHTTTYTHGSSTVPLSGDVTKVSYPLSSGAYDTTNYVYNVMHQPTQRTDGNSVVTNYSYSDGDGLLSAIAYPATTSLNVGITYDSYDRAYYVSDGTGSITDSFDDLNEVTQSVRAYTGLSSKTLTYSRYPDGTRSEITTPAGNLTYDYDSDGRYTSMVSPVGTSYASYYDNGWQETRTLPNGIVSTYSLNAVGALTGLSSVLSGTTVSAFSSFSYDGVFNLSGFSANYGTGSTLPNGSRSFGYDTKDRLTSSSIPTSSTTTVSSSYGFDYSGNRTTVNSTTIPFNSDNQCSSSGYTFDGNGNPTSYNGTSLSFDPENRVTAIGSANAAAYRADGLRASKTVSSATTYYLYDGGEPIVEMNSSGTVTAFNVFAPDGLVSRTAGSTTTEYVFDQQGNVADRTDTSGAVQSVTQYDGWGIEQAISGTPSDPFGYNAQSGYYLDRETGLYLCQHRFYDPANGRWLNRDPISYFGGANIYGYCAEGPLGAQDPRGHQSVLTTSLDGDVGAFGVGAGVSVGLQVSGWDPDLCDLVVDLSYSTSPNFGSALDGGLSLGMNWQPGPPQKEKEGPIPVTTLSGPGFSASSDGGVNAGPKIGLGVSQSLKQTIIRFPLGPCLKKFTGAQFLQDIMMNSGLGPCDDYDPDSYNQLMGP